jgi:hypothetical protein
MTSICVWGERYNTTAVKQVWQPVGDDAYIQTMILPSSHSLSVKSVARNEDGLQKTCEG